jgi:hypothetical protein
VFRVKDEVSFWEEKEGEVGFVLDAEIFYSFAMNHA